MEPDRPPGPLNLNRYSIEVPWIGIPTFMKLPLCLTPADLRAGQVDVAVGGAPWDGTNLNRAGAQFGPRAIRLADAYPTPHERIHQQIRLDPFAHLTVCDYGDAEIIVGDSERTFENIERFVAEIVSSDGVIPFVLGGDHAITWPSATAVAKKYGFGELMVFHLDAHTDTALDFQGNRYSHATPMRRLIESGAVRGEDFVQVGLRGYSPGFEDLEWMSAQGMHSHFMGEIEARGFQTVLDDAIAEARERGKQAYLSVDIDVADPSCAPGTGAPEPGGLTSRELLSAVRRCAAEVGIVAMDVVEVSPPYDAGNSITARLAHYCLLEGLTGIAMRRLGLTDPGYLHPEVSKR